MDYKVINSKTKEIVRDANVIVASTQLTYFLYEIALRNSKQYKIKYDYNYTNLQTIQFIDKENGYIHEFTNVPTSMGLFNTDILEKEIREIYKETYKGGE